MSCLSPEIRDLSLQNTRDEDERNAIKAIPWISLDFPDTVDADLSGHLRSAVPFITEALRDSTSSGTNKVLIHCMAGASRSASIAIGIYTIYRIHTYILHREEKFFC